MKRLVSFAAALILVISLVSCGKNKEFVFIIDDEELVMSQVDVFGYIFSMEHSLVPVVNIDRRYEDGKTYEQHYKEELEQDIIKTILLDKEAKASGFKINSEYKAEATKRTDDLINKLGMERLESRKIKREDVQTIYEWKVLGEAYANSKYADSDKPSDETGGDKDKETTGNDSDGASDNSNNEQYIKVFQVLFPTAMIDEYGMVKVDKDGNIITVPSDEALQMKEYAASFCEDAKNSDDMETLLKNYPAAVKGMERVLKYDDLDDGYRKAIDETAVGEVSNVIDSKYGYYVVKLIEKNDFEHSRIISDYEKELETNNAKQKLYEELYKKYIGNNNEYRNNDQWKLVIIENYY